MTLKIISVIIEIKKSSLYDAMLCREESATEEDTLSSDNADKWKSVIDDEMQSLLEIGT